MCSFVFIFPHSKCDCVFMYLCFHFDDTLKLWAYTPITTSKHRHIQTPVNWDTNISALSFPWSSVLSSCNSCPVFYLSDLTCVPHLVDNVTVNSDNLSLTRVNVALLVTPPSSLCLPGSDYRKEGVSWWEIWYPASHTQNWQDLISVLLGTVEGSISVMFTVVGMTDSSCSVLLAAFFSLNTEENSLLGVSCWHTEH